MLKKSNFFKVPLEKNELTIDQLVIIIKEKAKDLIIEKNFKIDLNYKNIKKEKKNIDNFPKIKIKPILINSLPITYFYEFEIEIENNEKIILKKRYSELLNFFLLINNNFPYIIFPSFPKKIFFNSYLLNILKLEFKPKEEKIKIRTYLLNLFFEKLFSNTILKILKLDFFKLLALSTQDKKIDILKYFKKNTKKLILDRFDKKNVCIAIISYFDSNFYKMKNLKKILKNLMKKFKVDVKLESKIKNIKKIMKKIILEEKENKEEKIFQINELQNILMILYEDLILMEEIIEKYLNYVEMEFFQKSNTQINKKNIFESISNNDNLPKIIHIKINLLKFQMKIILKNLEDDLNFVLSKYNILFLET